MKLHSWIALAAIVALNVAWGHAQDAIFQGNEARTGEFPELRLHKQPVVLWKFAQQPLTGDWGGVLVAGGRVFVSDRGGGIYAVGASDGRLLWTRQEDKERRQEDKSYSEVPLVMGDIAYFGRRTGIAALSVLNGETVWSYDILHGASESSPLMIANVLIVCGCDGIVYGLDAQSGAEEWKQDVLSDAPPAPLGFDAKRGRYLGILARPKVAASDGKTLFQPIFDQSRVVALDCASGKPRWSFAAGGWIFANPVATGGAVYIGTNDQHFYCLDKNSGKVLWKFKANGPIGVGAAVHDHAVYFGSRNGTFYRLAAKTGEKQWSFELACPVSCAPLVTDDTVYLTGREGQLYALQTSDGSLRWKMRPTPDSQITGDLSTDGRHLFLKTKPNRAGAGEMAVFAIGPNE